MRKLKILWFEWKKKVDKYNSNIDYVNYEDAWSYLTPLRPLLLTIGFILFYVVLSFIMEKPIIPEYIFRIGLATFIPFSLALILQWKTNYK